jgi:hypothetical protein
LPPYSSNQIICDVQYFINATFDNFTGCKYGDNFVTRTWKALDYVDARKVLQRRLDNYRQLSPHRSRTREARSTPEEQATDAGLNTKRNQLRVGHAGGAAE